MEGDQLDAVLREIKEGKHEQALCALEGILAKKPHDIDALNLSGVLSLGSGEVELAERFFEEALGVDPLDFVAWGERGRCHLLKGEYEKARTCLAKASALFDDREAHAKSHYQLLKGFAEVYLGETKESGRSFEIACILDRKSAVPELAAFARKCVSSSRIPLMKRARVKGLLERIVKRHSKKK